LGGLRSIKTNVISGVDDSNTVNTPTETTNNTFIFEDAIQIIESEYTDANIGFTLEDEPKQDSDGIFYSGKIYSIEMQASGGTCHLATIKMYEDGTIIEQYD